MDNRNRAPRQWNLEPRETLNSYKNWKENLVYTLSLDTAFKPFLVPNATWGRLTTATPFRGFVDDADTVPVNVRRTKEEKVASLNLMLGQIANFAQLISRDTIVKSSTSLNYVWNTIRGHFHFNTTGSRFIDLISIKLEASERPEDLYQRLVSFVNDNLLTADSGLTHHLARITTDEEMSPTLENVVVLLWLERIHVKLPALVKQRYGTELRNKTLASIKPEISQALSSLLTELSSSEESSRILRAQGFQKRRGGGFQRNNYNNDRGASYAPRRPDNYPRQQSKNKYCCLCRTANRSGYDTHYLSECRHVPPEERQRMSSREPRVRMVNDYDDDDDEYDVYSDNYGDDQQQQHDDRGAYNQNGAYGQGYQPPQMHTLYDDDLPQRPSSKPKSAGIRRIPSLASVHRRVTTRKSPIMQCFYRHIPISLCLDTGAESNLISNSIAKMMDLRIEDTKQGALQADEKTPLAVLGEVTGVKINKGAFVFIFDGLVVEEEIGYIVAGEPFLEDNDIAMRPAKRIIIIQGKETIPYASSSF